MARKPLLAQDGQKSYKNMLVPYDPSTLYPRRKDWVYQICLTAVFYNRRTRKTVTFGDVRTSAKSCWSTMHDHVDREEYYLMEGEALNAALQHLEYDKIAAFTEKGEETDERYIVRASEWRVKKINKRYVQLWRALRDRGFKVVGKGKNKEKQYIHPPEIVFRQKKALSKREMADIKKVEAYREKVLESRYETPPKRLAARQKHAEKVKMMLKKRVGKRKKIEKKRLGKR